MGKFRVKILLIDIETAPNIAYVWGAWKQNIGQNQWVQKSHIMSYAAKWLHSDKIFYEENRKSNDRRIVKSIFALLDEADVVVAHYGRKFDLPTIIGRGAIHGLKPPSPYSIVDTKEIASREFRLVSNSLANLCEELGLRRKSSHAKFPGFELWLECLRNNDAAWEEMKEYNIADLLSLEEVYLHLRPYARNHPNLATPTEDGILHCPKCGSEHINYRGHYRSKAGLVYRRFVCINCGGWARENRTDKEMLSNALRSV